MEKFNVVAVRGNTAYIIQIGERFYLMNVKRNGFAGPSKTMDSFLKFGYFKKPDNVPEEHMSILRDRVSLIENDRYDDIEEIEKFNPYHDRLGRFTTAGGATSMTIRTKDPKKQHMADKAVERARGGSSSVRTAKSNLVEGLGQKHAENIEGLIGKSPEYIQKAWDKAAGTIVVEDNAYNGKAHCYKNEITVHIENDGDPEYSIKKFPYEVTMHESAHAIDNALGSGGIGVTKLSEIYKDGLFQKTLEKEAEAHVLKFKAERGISKIQDARKEFSFQIMGEYRRMSDVNDIFEGASKGKIPTVYGHGKKYWNKHTRTIAYQKFTVDAHKVSSEAFAEMFSATVTNPESLAEIKKWFPESYAVFEEMLSTI